MLRGETLEHVPVRHEGHGGSYQTEAEVVREEFGLDCPEIMAAHDSDHRHT